MNNQEKIQNPECRRCGLLRSTVYATKEPCIDGDFHNFGEAVLHSTGFLVVDSTRKTAPEWNGKVVDLGTGFETITTDNSEPLPRWKKNKDMKLYDENCKKTHPESGFFFCNCPPKSGTVCECGHRQGSHHADTWYCLQCQRESSETPCTRFIASQEKYEEDIKKYSNPKKED